MSIMDEYRQEPELEKFNIRGNEFSYKPMTAKDELEWLDDFVEVNEKTGQVKSSASKLNKIKLQNLKAPLHVDDIKKIWEENEDVRKVLEEPVRWDYLNYEQRFIILSKFGDMLTLIVNIINTIDKANMKKKRYRDISGEDKTLQSGTENGKSKNDT